MKNIRISITLLTLVYLVEYLIYEYLDPNNGQDWVLTIVLMVATVGTFMYCMAEYPESKSN